MSPSLLLVSGTGANAKAAPFVPKVVILMGAYNGAKHLQAQLDSLLAQTLEEWVLVVSDDGSSDDTLDIVQRFRLQLGPERVYIRRGPRQGFVANFLSLACQPGVRAPYYAFCDQDDVWYADKLERALEQLKFAGSRPALLCGRTRFVSEEGEELGFSHPFQRPPCFRNALVQSIAGGNTMVFNEHTQRLIRTAGPEVRVASHDWWLYLLVSGAGGNVVYDPRPALDYRQHASNLVGGNVSLQAKLLRVRKLWAGRFRYWNDLHERALAGCRPLLTAENRQLFDAFCGARHGGLWQRIRLLREAGLFRQSSMGTVAVYLSCLLKKF